MSKSERQGESIGRREFIRVGLLGGTAAAGLATSYWYLREIRSGEGNEEYDLVGEKLQGGEIIDEKEVVQRYLQAIEDDRPLTPDPTIIRSTLYHAMRFFGTDVRLAKRRSENVSISNNEIGGCLGACTYDSASGLGVELNKEVFVRSRGKLGWILSLLALSHEAYHISVKKVSDWPETEDYGVLGSYTYSREKRGFFRGEEQYQGEFTDLINAPFPVLVGEEITRISLPEEFFTEFAKLRYYRHLLFGLPSGLGQNSEAVMYQDYSPFPNFIQSLVNIQDTQRYPDRLSWQDWWGGALSAKTIDKLHFESDRFSLYRGIGERILFWNENENSQLSETDTAALGVVAFADFVEYDLAKHEVLNSLISEPITAELIASKAKLLAGLKDNNRPQPLNL